MSQQFAMGRGTQLLDLPEELLGAVLRQLPDGDSRLQVCSSSKRLATALLQHTPAIQLTYPLAADHSGGTWEERRIATFLARALSARQAQLHLTLQPEGRLLAQLSKKETSRVLTSTLGAVELCSAVTHLTVEFPEDVEFPPCQWKPLYSAGLASSYPSLTSLTLVNITLTTTQLGQLLSHPLLLPRLQHLDMTQGNITDKKRSGTSPFIGSRLQRLSLGCDHQIFTPHLSPLAAHLTRLDLHSYMDIPATSLAAALGALTALQWLYLDLTDGDRTAWACFPALAQLPSLHTLQLKYTTVGPDQLDALLALTQVTRLQLHQISDLTSSWANAACSWRHLTVRFMDWVTVAHLPLHSLTHPLQFNALIKTGCVTPEVLAAADVNVWERNTAGVQPLRAKHQHLIGQPSSSSSPEGHFTPGVPGSSSGQGGRHWAGVSHRESGSLATPGSGFSIVTVETNPTGLFRAKLCGMCITTGTNAAPTTAALTFKQRQQLLVLEQHPVSVEVLRRCAEAGYGRLDSHGRPMGSMAEQLSPAGLAPSPTDIFIPTQEGLVGRPAARTAPYNAHHCLSTVRLHVETGVSRRALSKCRKFFVYEQCVLPNPHRPGKTSTVGREFQIVSTYMRRKTLVESLLQLFKHGGGRYMELPALLQLMSLHTCKEAMKTVDVHDLQQHMGQLRAEVRRKEDATAAAQRSAKAERQITDAAHKQFAMGRGTQLLDLPEELLGAVLSQLPGGDSRLQVCRSSKRLATALLQHTPAIQLTYPLAADHSGGTWEERRIATFLARALSARQAQLHLTLQPEGRLLAQLSKMETSRVLPSTLGAVELCSAVTHLTVRFPEDVEFPPCQWKPLYSAGLASSYPSLTSLTLVNITLTTTQLGQLLSHPLLLTCLKHLDVEQVNIIDKMQPGTSPFIGSRLQSLSLGYDHQFSTPHLSTLGPHIAPLAPHLTRLDLHSHEDIIWTSMAMITSLAAALSALTALQWLYLEDIGPTSACFPALSRLPSLHTLQLKYVRVGPDELDTLLALTQITHLQLECFTRLDFSRASAACSWRQLIVTILDLFSAHHLPLHSLTHPLQFDILLGRYCLSDDMLAAAEVNLWERNKAGLMYRGRRLSRGIDKLVELELLDLPDELLGAVLRQLRDRKSKLLVFRTSKRLAIALLQHTPAIELRYPLGADGNEDDQENETCPTALEYSTQRLAPFLTHALLARKAALKLSLQPAARLLTILEDCDEEGAAKLASCTLNALELCPAVTHLTVKFRELLGSFWQPGHTAALAAAYPSLTSLTLKYLMTTFNQLSQLVCHPVLLSQLQRLDISDLYMCGWDDSEAGEPRNSPFTGLRTTAACSWRQLELCQGGWGLDWVTAAHLPLHSLTHPLQVSRLWGSVEVGVEVLAAAELNLCGRNKAGLEVEDMPLSLAGVELLTELYLSHCHLDSSSHSGPSTSLPSGSTDSEPSTSISSSLPSSSSPEGHMRAEEAGSGGGLGVQQGAAAGGQALMQRLGPFVNKVTITLPVLTGRVNFGRPVLSPANLQALAALSTKKGIAFKLQDIPAIILTQEASCQCVGTKPQTSTADKKKNEGDYSGMGKKHVDEPKAEAAKHRRLQGMRRQAMEASMRRQAMQCMWASGCWSSGSGRPGDGPTPLSRPSAHTPPAADPSSSNSHPEALVVGLPHIGKVLAEKCEVWFDPATQNGVDIDPGAIQAVRAAWDEKRGNREFESNGTVETDDVTLSDTQQAMNKPLLLAGTQLLDLPDEVLGAVLRQLRDGESRLHVFRTSKRLAIALLQHTPAIELEYPLGADGYEDSEENGTCPTAFEYRTQRLAPFLTHALLARKAPLQLSLQPAEGLLNKLKDFYEVEEDSKAVHAVAAELASNTLGALELCPAVTHLTVTFTERVGCFWQPGHTAALTAAYPSLTSLTMKDFMTTFTQLSKLLRHPALLSQLQRLDISDLYMCGWDDSEAGEPRNSPFTGLRLQQLSLGVGYWDNWPHLAPLAPHLTQLAALSLEPDSLAAVVHSLTNLQHLRLRMEGTDASQRAVLSALAQLPSLHTLELPVTDVGQVALDQLLALTQVTFLCVRRFKDIALSRATAACSWKQLELEGWDLDWVTAAHLPLHSLTHPLQVSQLVGSEEVGVEVLAAAELNLCEYNKAGLEVEDMPLSLSCVDLLTELYLSHCHLASSNDSGPSTSTSLPSSSSPEGHMPAEEAGSGRGLGGRQGAAAGGQALLQRLGPYVNKVTITLPVLTGRVNFGRPVLSPANLQALAALSTKKGIAFELQDM
ncbi:hypothetical protein QJQ45_026716 [Haematococcus lacustris]|nr:hypothetical protein QJQ45_026716 [Haematococcus lacustris]